MRLPVVDHALPTATHGGRLTRRRFGLAVGAVTLAGLLNACGSDDPAPALGATEPSGPWTWTDDRDQTVELDSTPERLVVSQWLLPAFWALGIKPVGVLTFMPWGDIAGYAEAGIAEDDVTVLSTTYGEVDLEKMVGLKPDLIVLDSYADSETLWGFTDLATQQKAGRIAPLVAVSAETDLFEGIDTRHELAAALGADLDATTVVEARGDFEAASAEIEKVLAARPGLSVAFVGPYEDGLWVAPAEDYADLTYLEGLGLDVWKPAQVPDGDILSWENATGVDADLLILDDRDDVAQASKANPVFAELPAVEARQVAAAWRFALPYEYGAYARSFRALTPALQRASILSA
ncbi:ABC transporter substrate-binding protein [Nocardioides endophyticus]|uniref:ABC transporter substrate-binding protein n=1 Tax=Nocardioides endophyticus TaxID=1353775 RepID=A0ABP8Z234_9ACTN